MSQINELRVLKLYSMDRALICNTYAGKFVLEANGSTLLNRVSPQKDLILNVENDQVITEVETLLLENGYTKATTVDGFLKLKEDYQEYLKLLIVRPLSADFEVLHFDMETDTYTVTKETKETVDALQTPLTITVYIHNEEDMSRLVREICYVGVNTGDLTAYEIRQATDEDLANLNDFFADMAVGDTPMHIESKENVKVAESARVAAVYFDFEDPYDTYDDLEDAVVSVEGCVYDAETCMYYILD